jgi:hypothetical protein
LLIVYRSKFQQGVAEFVLVFSRIRRGPFFRERHWIAGFAGKTVGGRPADITIDHMDLHLLPSSGQGQFRVVIWVYVDIRFAYPHACSLILNTIKEAIPAFIEKLFIQLISLSLCRLLAKVQRQCKVKQGRICCDWDIGRAGSAQ